MLYMYMKYFVMESASINVSSGDTRPVSHPSSTGTSSHPSYPEPPVTTRLSLSVPLTLSISSGDQVLG